MAGGGMSTKLLSHPTPPSMRLRRGMVRESCDFCHRRKLKCDRLFRGGHGHTSCSPCSQRQIECSIDDSNDIRLRRRQKGNGRPLAAVEKASAPCQSQGSPYTISDTTVELESPSSFPSGLLMPTTQRAENLPEPDFGLFDDSCQLHPDSIFFLDGIFMSDFKVPLYALPVHQPQTTSLGLADGGFDPSPWSRCGIEEAIFLEALHAYFTYAAACLPVLLQGAFWKDYDSGRCSLSLVCAVACRGLAFTSADDKWDMQQRVACQFRDTFLEPQLSVDSSASTRVDDIEALALMVQFEYAEDAAGSDRVQSRLSKLFLTHDSLVLMTMQSGTDAALVADNTGSEASAACTQESERRILLFWHVYGLDAFRCLDKKIMSRIPEGDAATAAKPLSRADSGSGYLDAILSLAILAREIVSMLCSSRSKREGLRIDNVKFMYGRLKQWRHTQCPAHLQRLNAELDCSAQPCDPGYHARVASPSVPGVPSNRRHSQLQRAVVWMLEINCYMQIEDCVSRYGIQDGGDGLSCEMLALQVESETIGALKEATELAQSLLQLNQQASSGASFSLADLASSIIRDCCAGACFWSCNRGRDILQMQKSCGWGPTLLRPQSQMHRDGPRQLSVYVETSKTLRNAVASAASHKDTKDILTVLDEHILSLQNDMA